MPTLLLSVRFHDGRYHGSGEWPPSPARLFQALVAGAARGTNLSALASEALTWLESRQAPTIVAPSVREGRGFKTFVPNNDLDAVGGDPVRISEIRTAKIIRPRHFDADVALLYAWTFADEDARHARAICEIADHLYQLGRGIDMAWAHAECLDDSEAQRRLDAQGGVAWRPGIDGEGVPLACPQSGSLASLTARFAAMGKRFEITGKGKKATTLFRQPPKPSFAQRPYNSPSSFLLFDIRKADGFAPWRQEDAVALTEALRDGAVARLKIAIPDDAALIDRVFVSKEAGVADKAQRIRITPLPSIGHMHTDPAIRRVLVTVPTECPIPAGDIAWAFSGLVLKSDEETGEILQEVLPTADRGMLAHYGVDTAARVWRSVTPASLGVRRRRIDPARMQEEAKAGAERASEERAALLAIAQALRHAGIATPAATIRVQREPFAARGRRAEAFATSRFAKESLWHVEIGFEAPVSGPLVIGNGRYLGLGLMAPLRRTDGLFAFVVEGLPEAVEPLGLARALRRAVMARVQDVIGAREMLAAFFTGHAEDGAPARSGGHAHLAFLVDAPHARLIVAAPHVLERRAASRQERDHLSTLELAVEGFRELRAGAAGRLTLTPATIDPEADPLFAPAQLWESLTPYRVTRHARLKDAAAALEADLLTECLRAGLPRPDVAVLRTQGKPGLGLFGHARLTFKTATPGPLLLGRDRHFGGGLFARRK